MVLLNIYGKINIEILSSKIGIGISNLRPDWIEGFQDDFEEEIAIRLKNIENNKKYVDKYGWSELPQYYYKEIVETAGWREDGKSDKEIIAENLISLEVLDFKNSCLTLKNPCLDSPTCEKEYPEKFIEFCTFLQDAYSAKGIIRRGFPFCIYSESLYQKPLVLSFLSAMLKRNNEIKDYTVSCIESLKEIGKIIDNF